MILNKHWQKGLTLLTTSEVSFIYLIGMHLTRQVEALKKSQGSITDVFYVIEQSMSISYACINHSAI